jgi:transcriptional regulator with XRE-family HTH domain
MEKKKKAFLKKLAARIVYLREKQGVSQAELAEKCDKDKQSINRLEKGNVNPSVFYLQEIADALGVGLNELLKFD